jgi:hypothetical protein
MLSARKDKHFRIPASLDADFVKIAKILGLKQEEAAEIALKEWIQGNRDEAQKRLDMYAEKGIVINRPEGVTINIAVFQKAELLLAKEDLQRLLGILPDVKDPASRREMQLELAKALKVIQPVFVKTRDPELAELSKQAEQALQQ